MWPDEINRACGNRETLTLRPDLPRTEDINHLGSGVDSGDSMRDFMAITKALADETRVRVLLALQRGELCVCQIVELTGLATSTISKHMSILKQARLVEGRKDGRWMYYRLAGDPAPELVQRSLDWVAGSLAQEPMVLNDRKRLAAICTSDPQELCAARGSCGSTCRNR
jgi:DNA-binding transcriptional ArsR family regulator